MSHIPEKLEHSVARLFVVGIAGTEMDAAAERLLTDIPAAGVCFFARNIRTAQQTRELTNAVADKLGPDSIRAIDQEGGTVDRLRRIVTPMAAANSVRTPAQARQMGELTAEILGQLGFNVDFAPVVDVVDKVRSQNSNGLFTRPFADSADGVVELAGAFLDGLQANGIVGCLKHFPGLGAAAVDSHEELPSVHISDDELKTVDMFPYSALIESKTVHSVMVAHAAFPDSRLQERLPNGKLIPSSLSKAFVTGQLREHLGFKGMVFTDDLEMGAIMKEFGIGEASVLAIEAGVDALLICAGEENIRRAYDAVLDAVRSGRISAGQLQNALARSDRFRLTFPTPIDLDENRLIELSDQVAQFNATL